jgi:acyl-CoA synthetase (NDP forming)
MTDISVPYTQTGEMMTDIAGLSAFFNPKSVAVVGASSDPKKPGNKVLKNLHTMGYKGKVFPINPHEDSILGLRCYGNILEIPEPVEICVLIVSVDITLRVARELVQRKQRFNDVFGAICMSAGFGELNIEEAKLRETELVQILSSASIRLIGPNCLGIIDAHSRFNTNFDISKYPKGGLSLLTQSGAFANSFLFWAEDLHLTGLSKFASIGNMADVSMSELLMFLKEDETTRVIGIYMEGLPDPRVFFGIAREVAAVKPIVVFKSGKSDIGSTAAMSHTGAVAGKDAIYDGAFKQTGIIRARSVSEFYNTLRALEKQPLPEGDRVCILTHMGGPGTICLDEISSAGMLHLAEFSPETREALKSMCSPMANIGSPDGYVDLSAAHHEKLHNQALKALFLEKNVDIVIQLLAPSSFIDQKLLVKEIIDAFESQEKKRKPLYNAVTFGHFARKTRLGLEKAGIPTFEHSDMLARVAGNVADYSKFRREVEHLTDERKAIENSFSANRMLAAELISGALDQGRSSLIEPEAYKVCEQYGIRSPPFRLEDSLERAVGAARVIGYPVVLKAAAKEIVHKTVAGGVILGIGSDSSFLDAYRRLMENVQQAVPGVQSPKVLIQKMLPATTELVVGAVRDRSFGPTVMFGLGGVNIEALKLVKFRLSPLGLGEARDLICQTLPPALLNGRPCRAAINIDSIAEVIVSLGRMLEELPHIKEVDLNPIISCEGGCMAVDARIIISR